MGPDRRRGWRLVAAQFALLAILVFVPPGEAWAVPRPVRLAGVLLRVAGLVAIAAGAIYLGRSLSVHPEPPGHAVLRTGGVYRYVRHPIYSGLLLLGAGIALTSGSLLSAGAFVLLIAVISMKARFEEQLLRERFPGYEEYARRTPAFLPRFRALFL